MELPEIVEHRIEPQLRRHLLAQLLRLLIQAFPTKYMATGQRPVDASRGPVMLVAGEADLLRDLAHGLDAKTGEVEAQQREVERWICVVV